MEPAVVLREEDGHQPVLMFAGHDLTPSAALDAAEAWLKANGADEWALHDARAAAQPSRLWWAGDDIGGCGPDHPKAQPMTAVHLPGVAIPKPKG